MSTAGACDDGKIDGGLIGRGIIGDGNEDGIERVEGAGG